MPTRQHPIHSNDQLHSNADLIFTDIEYHSNRLVNLFNKSLRAAREFFTYHFDDEFYEDSYSLFREKINSMLAGKMAITISCFKMLDRFITEKYVLDFVDLLNTEPGLINHYSKEGNLIVYNKIISVLQTLKGKRK